MKNERKGKGREGQESARERGGKGGNGEQRKGRAGPKALLRHPVIKS